MRSLDLNLASRPFRNNTLVWAGYLILLVGAVGFSYWNISSYREYNHELAEREAEKGDLEQQQADLNARRAKIVREVRGFDVKSIGRRTSKANEVIEWKAFSWTRLFNRLEEMLPHKVRMTSVRPVFRDRDRDDEDGDSRYAISVTVDGLARDLSAFHEIQTKLIQHDSFGWVKPRFANRADNGEYAFGVDFLYYPGEPEAAEEAIDEVVDEAAGDVAKASEPEAETTAAQPDTTTARAETPKLPAPNQPAAEVTDDWAERAEPEETAAADSKAPKTQRRSLPPVQPETTEPDEQRRQR
jgi:Tfp pilus assembly protein PilN